MRQITTCMGSRTPGIRVRGFRITGTSLGQVPTVTKTIWWEDSSCDTQVVSTALIRSHTFATYQRKQVQP